MGDYLKLFETHAEYETYITGSDKILPNVSYCVDNNDVHYNPYHQPIVAKFNVTSTDSATKLCYSTSSFSEMEIDGVVQPNVVTSYTFDSIGEHTVKYTLLDPTSIGAYAFDGCYGLASITIPSNVTSIGDFAFYDCTSLTSITIPNSVTSIGYDAFSRCSGLTSISVESGNTVYDSRNNCNAIIETATNTLLYGYQNTIIPNSVTSIGDNAFYDCSGLTSITIPSGVTSIGSAAFTGCWLETITSLAPTAPSIEDNTFEGINSYGFLYIPSGSTGYDVWMGTGDYYLGQYNWEMVEQ